MRITKDGAGAGSFQALGTTLAGWNLHLLVGPTLDRGAAHLGAANVAGVAATTATGSHVPGLVVHVGDAVQGALAAHLRHNATGTAAVVLLKLRGTLQNGACGTLADRGAIQAGAVGATIRHKLYLVVVQIGVEYTLACRDKLIRDVSNHSAVST